MKFDLIMTGGNPPPYQTPAARFFASTIDLAVLAEELGYNGVWTAEHHFSDGYFSQQFPVLAAIAARTTTLRIGTYIVVLPLHHPIEVAELSSTLDAISNGRFDLGLGQGYYLEEFSAFGIPHNQRPSRLQEGLEIIRGLWEQDSFGYDGKRFQFDPVSLRPKPTVQKLPMWVAGIAPDAIDRAARFGCHLAGAGSPEVIAMYEESLSKYGYDPAQFYKGTLRMVHIADTREQAWHNAHEHIFEILNTYNYKLKEAGIPVPPDGFFGIDPVPQAKDLANAKGLHFYGAPLIVGTPEDAIRELERSAADAPVTHQIMWMQIGGMDPRLTEHSMRLFAEKVAPHFN
ncbi:MAG: alkanesulfonate monooxygenase SsuD [Gammaproteobacteria bacterium]|jgi:alkanesulfonate monooxygenase SsuD/methylene tetrahydromethanopterin reductase-like flavin-dependent oxidoreductase (luciferase family)